MQTTNTTNRATHQIPARNRLWWRARRFVSFAAVSVVVVMLSAFAVGCNSAVPATPAPATPQPAPTPEPSPTPTPEPPPPTLLGTWERITYDRDDSGTIIRKETQTLTFSETHYFEWERYQDTEGRTLGIGDRAGRVSISLSDTANTVTKTYDDDGEIFSVDKEYLFAGGGDVLFIHHWGSDDAEESFDRFTRVADAPMAGGPPATLRGTWRQTEAWDDDEDGLVTQIRTLTFFGTRFVEHNVRHDSLSGEQVREWSEGGGWTDTGTSVSKMYFEDDRMVTVDKHYVLAGDVLAINAWWAENPRAELDLSVFTRVQDPVPASIEGVWTHVVEDGGWAYTLTVGDPFTYDEGDVDTAASVRSGFTLTGSSRHDRGNGFLFVTVEAAARTEDGSPDEDFDPAEFVGHELRFAYAPTDRPDKIVLSPYDQELEYDGASSTWENRPDRPYGGYWLVVERQ